jgi:hypothetical protein
MDCDVYIQNDIRLNTEITRFNREQYALGRVHCIRNYSAKSGKRYSNMAAGFG